SKPLVAAETPEQFSAFYERCEEFRALQISLQKWEIALLERRLAKAKADPTLAKEIDELANKLRIVQDKLAFTSDRRNLIPPPVDEKPAAGDWAGAPLGAKLDVKRGNN